MKQARRSSSTEELDSELDHSSCTDSRRPLPRMENELQVPASSTHTSAVPEANRTSSEQKPLMNFQLLAWLVAARHQDHAPSSTSNDEDQIPSGNALPKVDRVLETSLDVDGVKLNSMLADVHVFLSEKMKVSQDRKVYVKCVEGDVEDLDIHLRKIKSRRSTSRSVLLARKLRYVDMAKDVVEFFVPVQPKAITTKKCLGALRLLLEASQLGDYRRFEGMWLFRLERLKTTTKMLRSQLSGEQGSRAWATASRQKSAGRFIRAWVHSVIGIVSTSTDSSMATVNWHLRKSAALLRKGLLAIRLEVNTMSLSEKEAFIPLGMVTLIIARLMKDMTAGHPDILSSYWSYLERLDMEVQEDSLNREHQEKTNHLGQEIGAGINVLEDQCRVLNDLANSMSETGQRSSTHALFWREPAIIWQCISSTSAKLQSFRGMAERASDLGVWNTRMIASNKDRQEAAILAFTIVTVIFLPLSFVAFVLGMNTADVRTMTKSQWVFWATAVPLTSIVVFLTLLWTGSLGSLRSGVARLWSRRKVPGTLPPQPAYEALDPDTLPSYAGKRVQRYGSYDSVGRPRRSMRYEDHLLPARKYDYASW